MTKLSGALLFVLGALVGFISCGFIFKRYTENLLFSMNKSETVVNLITLAELRNAKVEDVIRLRESELGPQVALLKEAAQRRDENGDEARKVLKQVEAYRARWSDGSRPVQPAPPSK